MKALFLGIVFTLCLYDISAQAQMVFTYRSPEHEGDTRYEYDHALLELALDETVDEYGTYKLEPSPVMNFARAIHMAEIGAFPNLILKLSYEEKFKDILDFVPIPVDRGIVGYRVFFVSKDNKEKLAQINTLEELKKLTIVQGSGWSDVALLEAAGFKVDALPSYENIFPYVAKGRADIFPRGANELLGEYESYKNVEGLDYDKNLALYYPLPRFFYTTKGNDKAVERIKLGLKKALQDGSFVKLWEDKYRESIDFLDLKDRKIFRIENANLGGLDKEYEKYMYDPLVE